MTFQRISRVAGVLLLLGVVVLFGVAVAAAMDNWQQAMSPGVAPDACGPYGAIGAVYNATGGISGPLGGCTTKELRADRGDGSDSEIDHAVHANKYQLFANGAIFYNDSEGTAFALSKTLYDLFKAKGAIGAYGLPITSVNLSGSSCKGYFQKGYIFCSGTSGFWADIKSAETRQSILTLPYMRLPYEGSKAVFNSGPHSYQSGGILDGEQRIGDGSGLDFTGKNVDVLAMASGTVIDIDPPPCTSEGFGSSVAIRNDFSGTVLIYGHLNSIPEYVKEGVWLRQGTVIGNTGATKCGKSTGPHIHVELRDGTDPATCVSGGNCDRDFGSPIDWNGVILDGHIISAFRKPTNTGVSFAYDGVAVASNLDPTVKHDVLSGVWPDPGYRVSDIKFRDRVQINPTTWVLRNEVWEAQAFVTAKVADWCDTQPSNVSCVNNRIDAGNVIFDAGGTWDSDNTAITPTPTPNVVISGQSGFDIASTGGEDIPVLISSNQPRPFVPRYVPPYPGEPTPIPSNGDTCPTDNRPGVYFYAQPNYQPACVFSTIDIPAFSATSVGDNNLRSVRIVGDYQVKLYREISFGGGAYEELNRSEGDITWRSMGTDVSSARVINKAVQSNCPTDNRNGVYLYADRDLAGACYFTTADVSDLGTTAVGDNNVSSAKIVGYYTVKLYENTSFGGRSDELNGNGYKEELNLDIRSLGGAYSSMRISAQAGADLVSNVRVASGRSYEWNKCKVGAQYYIDRSYIIESVSQADYSNLWCIRTANDDSDRTDKEFLSFELNRNATIYVYFDRRMTSAPSWVGTLYNQNSKRIYTSDGPMDYFVVYSCKSTPGVITLGGPKYNGGSGAGSMYVVAFREEDSASQFCNGTFPVPPTPTYTPAPTPTATEVFPTPVPPPTTVPEITDAHLFAEQGAIAAGQPARFTIVVYNAGSLDSVALAAQLPPGLRYVDGSASNGATYDLAAHQIRWAGTIFNSQTLVIQFEALLTDTSLPAVTVNLTVAGQGAGVVAESAVIQVAPPATNTPTITPTAQGATPTPTATSASGGQPPGPDTTPVPGADRLYLPAITK